ncbi:unnamed protein product, partial [Didymodactylos carnosus]
MFNSYIYYNNFYTGEEYENRYVVIEIVKKLHHEESIGSTHSDDGLSDNKSEILPSTENAVLPSNESEKLQLGQLEYSLFYSDETEELTVEVVGINYCLAVDDGIIDLLVRLQVSPGIQDPFETKPHRRINGKSIINESFTFKNLPPTELENTTIICSLYGKDRKLCADLIGELNLEFHNFDLYNITTDVKSFSPPIHTGMATSGQHKHKK